MKFTCIHSLAQCGDEIICFKKQRIFLMTKLLFREGRVDYCSSRQNRDRWEAVNFVM